MRVTVAAPAKVNLWLRVGGREASGFHAIDTLFCSLHLADSVMVRPGDDPVPSLHVGHARPLLEAPDLGPPQDNLAVRAARAFVDRAGLEDAPGVRLVKRIPPGAGLGGGSSDAAAVLRGLARLYPGAVSAPELEALGEALGSDVPFFVRGAPLAHGSGRGERLRSLPPLPARPVVVVIPEFGISTAEAYGWLDEDRDRDGVPGRQAETPDGREGFEAGLDWGTVAEAAVNDFEASVFRRHPELGEMKARLRDAGAEPALLAGSGSTVFGVFHESERARAVADEVAEADPSLRVLVTRSRAR